MSLHSIAASRKTVKRPSWRCNLPFKPELGCNLSPAPCTTASNRECMQQYTTWKRPPHRSEINSWIVAVNGQNHKEVEPASQKSENLRTVTKHTSIDPKSSKPLCRICLMFLWFLVFSFFVCARSPALLWLRGQSPRQSKSHTQASWRLISSE